MHVILVSSGTGSHLMGKMLELNLDLQEGFMQIKTLQVYSNFFIFGANLL